ncbi:MAG: septal ring lytic transglycosylase RlpA family protein [Gammaproteobacteria bacterium]|nr:septal ring lytic transglycosylase RlpA family protein [Gammaproteobacteria bacterium]NNM20225.1 septal ring lytic transglycosylase RlpA family protein [Gammaproteobacteria bacterium]
MTVRLLLITCAALVASCAGAPITLPPPQPEAQPEARRPAGNNAAKTAPYEVLGQRYFPITDATGYRERGVASWYGGKFHGRKTANGERYDMYQYTAAHKTLPLPTWVRVTNLRNGTEIVVKVNDRGPFVKNRLIDLSYAAALRLGMVDAGTTLVEVEMIDPPAEAAVITAASRPAAPAPPPATVTNPPATVTSPPAGVQDPARRKSDMATSLYVQVGAFGDVANAQRLQASLYNAGLTGVRVNSGYMQEIPVYRVQIGPVTGVVEYDVLMARLDSLGISDTHLVTE